MLLLNESVRQLNKIGPKTEELYNKLGVFTVMDLLNYFPRDYFIYEKPVGASYIEGRMDQTVYFDYSPYVDRIISVKGKIISQPILRRSSKGDIVIANMESNGTLFELLWFQAPYIRAVVKCNMEFVMHGKITQRGNRCVMIHPKVFTLDEYDNICGKLLPVYRLTKGLSNKQISNHVSEAIEVFKESEEYNTATLPKVIQEKLGFVDYGTALCSLHFPKDKDSFVSARKRFAFEEFFYFLYGMKRVKETKSVKNNNYRIDKFDLGEEWLSSLEFSPTNDQLSAIEDIKKDLSGEAVMQRMLQGDVGTGKTLVAFYACLAAVSCGYQCAFMAPTEVLASQHYNTFFYWCKNLSVNVNVVLLTGSMKTKEKKEAYRCIETGAANVVVGTHALIQSGLVFKNLALTITDEQHRFGVMQRRILMEKGIDVHSLFMTATPIPRTLAILLYGNSDISMIREKPQNRLPIKNCMIPYSKRKTAFNFILKEISKGHQAFIICPMIEENEMFQCENINDYQKRVRDFFPENIRIGTLHGKMSSEKKEGIMKSFALGNIDVLVSTTVIEVGIDIPNATVIMIENAERFGLSQLHQLRGRVGRGKEQSYCIYVNASDSKESEERINVLVNSNDGFKISEEDLKFRGPGDLFGIRQSGELDFVFADIFSDSKLLNMAKDELEHLFEDELDAEDERIIERSLIRYEKYDINCI